jgi:oligoribonuclease NrnB/cAMP/cGMP phosphodiesterase (DHH superfamily)
MKDNKVLYDYVIYHKNCFDGFSGFVLFMNTPYRTDSVFIYPDVPHAVDVPIGIENKNVIIIDVAYSPLIIEEISKKSKKMTFIDHHKTNYNEIMNLKIKANDEIIYDVNKCGASLVWQYFYSEKIPLFIKYIEDNDIGVWKYPQTLPFITYLETKFTTEPTVHNIHKWLILLSDKAVMRMIKKGTIYYEYKSYSIDHGAKSYAIMSFPSQQILNEYPNNFVKVGQYKVAVHNGFENVSQLGRKLVDKIKCDFAFIWMYDIDKKKYIVSLRSADEKADVGEIAKIFGGGGHRNASAFSFNSNKFIIDDLFEPDPQPRNYN